LLGVMNTTALVALALIASGAVAAPCSGVDRSLSSAKRISLAPIVELHLKAQLDPQVAAHVYVQATDVLHAFRVGRWQIIHVNNHATDDPYVFYADSPSRSAGYIVAWAGAAAASEEQEVARWAMASAPGIPNQLATCFAWYVTKGLAQPGVQIEAGLQSGSGIGLYGLTVTVDAGTTLEFTSPELTISGAELRPS
jgi:hypothetical protein